MGWNNHVIPKYKKDYYKCSKHLSEHVLPAKRPGLGVRTHPIKNQSDQGLPLLVF